MANQINDVTFSRLGVLGFDGSYNKRYVQWLDANGINTLQDLIDFFEVSGFTYTNINDTQYAYFSSSGNMVGVEVFVVGVFEIGVFETELIFEGGV